MPKYKYSTEFEINASVKMLFPYLSTASGLKEWFADEVKVLDEKTLDIKWDGASHVAKIAAKRTNSYVKFIFEPETEKDEHDQQYLEFRLDHNEITQTSFLRITDYSDMDDERDLYDLWSHLVGNLKESVGASHS